MSSAKVKLEGSSNDTQGSLSKVKLEAGGASPTASDGSDSPGPVDDSEDTGELNMSNTIDNAWLMRLPPSLWRTLKDMPDDEPLQIGHMRVWEDGNKIVAMRLRLDENIKSFENEPKQYHLSITNEKPDNNLFVFSEKDPGEFKPVTSFATYKIEKPPGAPKNDYKKDWKARGRSMRKAIPKNTSLLAKIQKETNCHPVMNGDYRRLRDKRLSEFLLAETAHTTPIGGAAVYGAMSSQATVHGFIKPTAVGKPAKVQENKFTRMPQDQLLDEIGKCFQQFKFWRLKSLKQTLKQPEAYLKETLQKIAELVKTGPFANTWALTPSMAQTLIGSNSNSKEEAAPGVDAEDDDDDEEEEEEEMEMEEDEDEMDGSL